MLTGALRRLVAVILGDDVPAAGTPSEDPCVAVERDPTPRPAFADVVAAAPAIRAELLRRARNSGAVIGGAAAVTVPAWSAVDLLLESGHTGLFLAVRLACDVPILALLWLLVAAPLGRRRPELLTFLILAIVQAEVAWVIPRVGHPDYYLTGYLLPVYASGCLLVYRPRWTAALIAVTWLALGLFVVLSPAPPSPGSVAGTLGYLVPASLIALVAHLRRHLLSTRELATRVRLEEEQERTRVLLGRLERLSHEDALTGLANRRRWDAELSARCAAARRQGHPVAVLLLDVDHFKRINDRHGHPGGDDVLRAVAGLLSSAVRGDDLVARLGGDELAVLLPGADTSRAAALAERLRAAAAGLRPGTVDPGELTVSVGVAVATGIDAFPVELMSRADQQLYRAKITRNAVGAPAPVPELSGTAVVRRAGQG